MSSNKSMVVYEAQQRSESLYSEQPLSKRLTQAVTYALSGGWFSPEQPLQAQHPESAGRQFDYMAGYNYATRPRRDSGIDFWQLRNFAQFYDILRLVIETRKDQIAQYDWSIVLKDQEVGQHMTPEQQARIDQATKFWRKPDGEHTWHTWLRGVLEDMLVLDANVFWPVYEGTTPLKIEMIDPATIKKVIDESGRTPASPLPAYQQIIKGVPASDYTRDQLLYFQRNWRSNAVYGFSPVEQVLMTINIGLRRESSQLEYFTTGNIPEAIAGVPDTWTPDQIKQFQTQWDARFSGNLAERRKLKFVPGDAAKILMLKGSDALLKNEFDEWIVRIICYAFSVSPQGFIKMMNRATAYSAAEEAREEGLEPTMDYIKDMIDVMLDKVLGMSDLEFMWSMEEDQDPSTQSQIDDKYIRNGTWGIDEVRQRMGMDPLNVPNMIFTSSGPIPVSKFADGTALDLLFGASSPATGVDDDSASDTDSDDSGGDGGSGDSESDGSGGGSSSSKQSDAAQDAADSEASGESVHAVRKGGASHGSASFRKRFRHSVATTDRHSHSADDTEGVGRVAKDSAASGRARSGRKVFVKRSQTRGRHVRSRR